MIEELAYAASPIKVVKGDWPAGSFDEDADAHGDDGHVRWW